MGKGGTRLPSTPVTDGPILVPLVWTAEASQVWLSCHAVIDDGLHNVPNTQPAVHPSLNHAPTWAVTLVSLLYANVSEADTLLCDALSALQRAHTR
jgi:hypothetical protein